VSPPDGGAIALADVHAALERVLDPCSLVAGTPLSLREMGLLRGVEVRGDGVVAVRFGVTGPGCTFLAALGQGVLDAVGAVPGVRRVEVALDAEGHWHEGLMSPDGRRRLAAARGPVDVALAPARSR